MNRMKTQKCPICGADGLKKTVNTETFTYKGHKIEIPDYVTYECVQCQEAVVDKATLKTSGKLLKDFQRAADGLLTGPQIMKIRKKLGLTQDQMAEIVGGGLKSVARYESGQVCQSRGMDNLLRILDKYPEMLEVIQKKETNINRYPDIIYMAEERDKRTYRFQEQPVVLEVNEAAYGGV